MPDSDIIVTGSMKELVGEDLTKYKEWVTHLKERFVADRGKMFASVASNGVLTVSLSEVADGVPKRVIGAKSFMPTVAGTGGNPVSKMKVVATYIDEKGAGAGALAGAELNTYVELLAREEHNIVWYTPEELEVLGEEAVKKDVLAMLKAAR